MEIMRRTDGVRVRHSMTMSLSLVSGMFGVVCVDSSYVEFESMVTSVLDAVGALMTSQQGPAKTCFTVTFQIYVLIMIAMDSKYGNLVPQVGFDHITLLQVRLGAFLSG